MKEIRERIGDDEVITRVAEEPSDLNEFERFVNENTKALAVDSESTGLQTYHAKHRSRLWQFGNTEESWVVPVELGEPFAQAARHGLRTPRRLVIQNAPYDLQEAQQHLGVKAADLWPRVLDTKILAHLVDSRGATEGGTGHGLADLTRSYISPEVADRIKGSMGEMSRRYKAEKLIRKQEEIWEAVETFDPVYLTYAGMDPVLTARLANKLVPLVPEESRGLVQFEHRVAEICTEMEATGFQLDREYTERLSEQFKRDEERWSNVAADLGVDKVASGAQVAEALLRMGVKLTKRTASGAYAVDSAVLEPLAEQGNELAVAVTEAKKARKWRTTWVDTFLSTADQNGRCHPSIGSLRARTGRMSITGIPAQTLPSSDWQLRRCFVADRGELLASIDYQAQELRVLAALSGDSTMIDAFARDADLHQMTADAAGVPRKVGKMTNFAKVYGSGARNIAEQAGVTVEVAKRVVRAFEETYPGVRDLTKKITALAQRDGFIVTPSGRRLYVDPDRAYAALNYLVQSTSRDVTCRGMVKVYEAGYGINLRLPVHDELIASLPMELARDQARHIGELMSEYIGPVHIN